MFSTDLFLFHVSDEHPVRDLIKFRNRWADLQFDGTIDLLNHGIETMTLYAKLALESKTVGERDAALEELECASFATSHELRKILAYIPGRFGKISFDAGALLFDAVSQFLLYTHNDIKWAIARGVGLTSVINNPNVTPEEVAYQEWVTPHIFHHLIPYMAE